MKNKLIINLSCLFCLISGYNQILADELYVVTTLPCLADLTENIGGDHVDVYSITKGVQDPHFIDAKPSYMVKLNKADLLIYSGLELEIGWLPLLIQGARNNNVNVGSRGNLNASIAIDEENILEKPRGEVDRSMGDVHPSGNPHYMFNPYNTQKIAELITNRLIELDPDNKKDYINKLDIFQNKLKAKITEFEDIFSLFNNLEVVCYHNHWSYLLDWLKIKPIGYIELRPGIPPTPRHKMEIIKLMKDKNIKVVIISSWKEPTKAEEVAEAVNAQLVVLPGEVNAMDDTENYFVMMEYIINKLSNAFSTYGLDNEKQKRLRKRLRGKK